MAESAEQERVARRLKVLRGSRTGKKGSITKRINQLNKYVEERAGRRATQLLLNCLHQVLAELEKVCTEISELTDDFDSKNDIEDIRFEVETCDAWVQEYLESRIDDPASSTSSKALAWVRKHAEQFGKCGESASSESGESEAVKISDLDGTVKDGLSKDVRGRLTYSDSRPATPRTLPQIPLTINPQPINAPIAVETSRHDSSIVNRMEKLRIGDELLVDENGDGNELSSPGGSSQEHVMEIPDDNYQEGVIKDSGELQGPQVPVSTLSTLVSPIKRSFSDGDVRKRPLHKNEYAVAMSETGERNKMDEKVNRGNDGTDCEPGIEDEMSDKVVAPTPDVANLTSFIFSKSRPNCFSVSATISLISRPSG